MKMLLPCPACQYHKDHVLVPIEIDEEFFDGKIETCSKGHKVTYISPYDRYFVLFQQSLHAYLEGFYFECFNTLYSGLENFWSTFIAAYHLGENDYDMDKTNLILKSFKMSKERKIEFARIYKLLLKQEPLDVNFQTINEGRTTINQFRNSIFHEGKIPSSRHCIALGNIVFKLVAETEYLMHNTQVKVLLLEYLYYLKEDKRKKLGIPYEIMPINYQTQGIIYGRVSPNTLLDKDSINDHIFEDSLVSDTRAGIHFAK